MNILKRFIKKVLVICVTVLTLTACVATPNNQTVINKNQDYLKNINSQNVNNDMNSIPQKVNESFELSKGKVKVNAQVVLPKTNVFPMEKIKPHEITNEEIDRFVNMFLPGKTLYEMRKESSKQDIEYKLINLKQQLAEYTNQSDIFEETIDTIKKEISDLETQHRTAKDESDIKDVVTNAHFVKNDVGDSHSKSYTKLENGNTVVMEAYKSQSLKNSIICLQSYEKNDKALNELSQASPSLDLRLTDPDSTQDIPNGKVSFAKAKEQADKIIQNSMLKDFVLDYSALMSEENLYEKDATVEPNKFYSFTYAKSYGGISIPYVLVDETELNNHYNNVPYTEIFSNETFQIVIDKDGNLKYAAWSFPGDTVESISDNMQLMPFNKVMESFKNYAKSIGNWTNMPEIVNRDIEIYKIELSMFLSALKDNPNEYITIPVWNFYCKRNTTTYDNTSGNEYEISDYEFRQIFVSINAIDGSNINPLLGY